jgi:hypothetical protein
MALSNQLSDRLTASVASGWVWSSPYPRYDFALRSNERGRDGILKLFALTKPRPAIKGLASSDARDLASFAHQAGEKLSFVGNAAKTGGVLTIIDGTLTAAVTLFGQYTPAGFQIAGDGQGGMATTYPPTAHKRTCCGDSPSPR